MGRIFKIIIVTLVILGLFWGSFSVLAKSEAEKGESLHKEKGLKIEEPWWEKIPAFETIFVILAGFYFILNLELLPRLLEKNKHKEHKE